MTTPEQGSSVAPDQLVEAVLAMLEAGGWDYEVADNDDDEGPLLRIVHTGTSAQWACYVHIAAGERYVAVYSVFPMDAPDETRQTTADLLTRINSGLVIGNFEIDLEDGEILAKTSIVVNDEDVTPGTIGRLLDANLEAMDRYFPAIAAVVSGEMTAAEAIKNVE